MENKNFSRIPPVLCGKVLGVAWRMVFGRPIRAVFCCQYSGGVQTALFGVNACNVLGL